MAQSKKYTDKDKKLHPIVKKLMADHHTEVVVTWASALRGDRGWTVTSKQLGWNKFHGVVPDIIKALERLKGTPRKKPKYRELKFASDREFNAWLKTVADRSIYFQDFQQDLQKIIVDKEGEILHANLQTDIWCGKFVNLEYLVIGKPVMMWDNDDRIWNTMSRLVIEEIIS